jgi:biopolymer transport protein TolR
MSGHSKMRKFSIPHGSDPNSSINVTPLVDVVLVMLIIFMVVTPLLEKDISVRMPQTEEVVDRSDIPPDQLVVKIESNGDLAINSEKVPKDEYVDRLSAILKRKKPADKIVFVVADDGASYGRLVGALDGAKQAGAETLGMATEVPSASPDAPPAPPTPPAPAP